MNRQKQHEQQLQKQFEQQLELLIIYKQSNQNKDVYLTETSLNDAMKWYNETFSKIKEQMVLNK
tara:strand:+ start:1748 stop:1939 length:192 start_codon:yes stop_codon:yes gene_type:complete